MKIIDLLNKIATYDEPILKIKYDDEIFKFDGNTYVDETGDSIVRYINYDLSNLNDEVEIIEEHKIERLTTWYSVEKVQNEVINNNKYLDYNIEMFFNKINEIIDKINE